MHPAYSVIFFTTASGVGYGLLAWLGAAHAVGLGPARWPSFWMLAAAGLLATAGLVSSTLHLGRPERAWRAFSQWRTSWLSREGVAALATYVPMAALGLAWLFDVGAAAVPWLAAAAAAGAVVTVVTTGMIYASLKPIPEWYRWDVPVVYVALALATGGVGFNLVSNGLAGDLVVVAVAAAVALKLRYWWAIGRARMGWTAAGATGLEGRVRVLDPPHTQPNFVQREMGFRVARRHVVRLRWIAALGISAPGVALAVGAAVRLPPAILWLAAAAMAVGVVVERWLFFAEARHAAQLYYGVAEI